MGLLRKQQESENGPQSKCFALARFVYLASTTLLTAAVLVECIFIRLLLTPYLQESVFKPAQCVYLSSRFARNKFQRCESKCLKLVSDFPCLIVMVRYQRPDGVIKKGFLFDQLRTLIGRKKQKCSVQPCKLRREENLLFVQSYNMSLVKWKQFPCFYHSTEPQQLLLTKLQTFKSVAHSLLWPLVAAICSLITIAVTWQLAGCKTWDREKPIVV